MKRILLAYGMICFLAGLSVDAAEETGLTFDTALQQALAELPAADRALLEAPIYVVRQSALIAAGRKEVERIKSPYAKLSACGLSEDADLERMEKEIRNNAEVAIFFWLQREKLARKLTYDTWLIDDAPLLEEFAVPVAWCREQGLTIRPGLGEIRSHTITLRDKMAGYRDRVEVEFEIYPSREAARPALMGLAKSLSYSARDFELCKVHYGEVCVSRLRPGPGFGFVRGNVVIKLCGADARLHAMAAWLDDAIKKQMEASAKAVQTVDKPEIVLTDPEPRVSGGVKKRVKTVPSAAAEIPRGNRDDAILVIEEPRSTSMWGATVPDGTRSVRVVVRIVDPQVERVDVYNGVERKRLKPSNGQVIVEIPLPGPFTMITATARVAPVGEWHGILGVQSVGVLTETEMKRFRCLGPFATQP